MKAHAHGADVDDVFGRVLVQLEGVLDVLLEHPAPAADAAQRVAAACGHVQLRARRVVGARPAVDGHRLLARRVGQRRGEGHEVEDVIGVQVAR